MTNANKSPIHDREYEREQGRIWRDRCPSLAQYLVMLGDAWIEEQIAEGADPADAEEHVRDCLPPCIWAAAKEAASRV